MKEQHANSVGSSAKPVRGNPDKTILHRWQPGQSGNPRGRPTYPTVLSKAYRAQLAMIHPDDPQGRTWAAVIAANLAQLALSKKPSEAIPAAQELCDRTEGRAHVSLSVGRQETEEVSIVELFNQHFERHAKGSAIGTRDDSPSGNGELLPTGEEDGSGPVGGGEDSTE